MLNKICMSSCGHHVTSCIVICVCTSFGDWSTLIPFPPQQIALSLGRCSLTVGLCSMFQRAEAGVSSPVRRSPDPRTKTNCFSYMKYLFLINLKPTVSSGVEQIFLVFFENDWVYLGFLHSEEIVILLTDRCKHWAGLLVVRVAGCLVAGCPRRGLSPLFWVRAVDL